MRKGNMIGLVLLWLCGAVPAQAAEGLASKDPLLAPGKVDFRYRFLQDSKHDYNWIAWSPIAKFGGGFEDPHGAQITDHFGGFIRPLQARPELGELIVGFAHVGTPSADDHEFQSEYRFPFGLGVGGGFVERNSGNDVRFGKVSFRGEQGQWSYIVEGQGQEQAHRTLPGGYVALYNDTAMAAGGSDGESWRAAVGYVAPPSEGLLRPTVELFYVDNSVGDINGTRFLFLNATLKFRGGFLSHPARLGRAMGPTGLEFGNPLGFLQPTWNRTLDVWELGGVADFRIVRTRSTARTMTATYEAVLFPFQLDNEEDALDRFFVGGLFSEEPGENSAGVMGGAIGRVGFLDVATEFDYIFDTREQRVVVGIIDKF